MAVADVNAARLRELLHYDPDTGIFTRKVRTSHRINVGDVAGTRRPDGYLKISVIDTSCLAHRLAWLYMTGEWPKHQVDHINGVRHDNRFVNLRDVTPTHNQQNQRVAHIRNKSCGLLGVTLTKGNTWQAQISVNGRHKHIGTYPTPQEASEAYLTAKRKLHAGCRI
jgi:hypothetical protein